MRSWILGAMVVLAAGGLLLLATTGPSPEDEVRSTLPSAPPSSGAGGEVGLRGRGTAGGSPDTEIPVTGTASLRGTVTRLGRGVPATVTGWAAGLADDRPPSFTVDAKADGAFRVEALPRGTLRLRAKASDGVEVEHLAQVAADGVDVEVTLRLPSSSEVLVVRARRADGAPAAARIDVGYEENAPSDPPSPRATDAAGEARFPGLSAGRVRVGATLPGGAHIGSGTVHLPRPEPLDLVVDLPRLVEGRVVDPSGAAVAGAEVAVSGSSEDGSSWESPGRSDASGAFRLAGRPGPATAHASAAGFLPGSAQVPDAGLVEVRLQRAAAIVGRVIDARTRAPVAGVPVLAVDDLWCFEPRSSADARAVSGPDGRYRLDGLPEREITLFAFGNGWVSEELGTVKVDHDYNPFALLLTAASTSSRDLPVVPAARVRGRVLDPEGGPVAGAKVDASVVGYRMGWCGNAPEIYAFGFVPSPPSVATDASGRFEIPALLPEVAVSVTASAPGWVPGTTGTRARGGETAEVEVHLGALVPDWWVDLQVVDDTTGAPIEGAELEGRAEATDAQGRTRIGPLREQVAWFQVSAAAHFGSGTESVPAPSDRTAVGDTVAHVVRLPPSERIEGDVRYPEGTPAPQAAVRLGAASGASDSCGGGRGTMTAYTNQAGHFTFTVSPNADPQPVRTTVERDERRWEAESSARPGDLDVALLLRELPGEAARAGGRVTVVAPDGSPIPRAGALVHQWLQAEILEDRRYLHGADAAVEEGSLRVVPEAWPVWIEVFEARDASNRPLPLGPAFVGPIDDAKSLEDLRIVLPAGRSIEGVVVDEAGHAVPGVVVRAIARHEELGTTHEGTPHASSRTDAAGQFRLERLGDLEYGVKVAVPSRWRTPPDTRTRPGGATLEIRLGSTARATIRVEDVQGRPVAGAPVWTSEDGTETDRFFKDEEIAATWPDGSVVLDGLDAGSPLALFVEPPEARGDLLAKRILDWVPADTTVRLEAAVAIEGQVVDEAGRPVAGAQVSAAPRHPKQYPMFQAEATTDGEGRFRLAPLPPAPAIVTVSGGPFDRSTTHEVDAPRAGWRVVHPRGRTLTIRLEGAPPLGAPLVRTFGRRTDAEPRSARMNPITESYAGPLRYEDLSEGTYSVWVRFPESRLVGCLEGLSPDAGTVTLPLVPERTVRGHIEVDGGARRLEYVRLEVEREGLILSAPVDAEGRFEIVGLPPGPIELRASAWQGDRDYSARLVVEAGADVVVRLERDP